MNLSQHINKLEKELLEALKRKKKPDVKSGPLPTPIPTPKPKYNEEDKKVKEGKILENKKYKGVERIIDKMIGEKLLHKHHADELYNVVVDEYEKMGDNPDNASTQDVHAIAYASGYDAVHDDGDDDFIKMMNKDENFTNMLKNAGLDNLYEKYNAAQKAAEDIELDESWWDAPDTYMDGDWLPTINAIDVNSLEGQAFDKETKHSKYTNPHDDSLYDLPGDEITVTPNNAKNGELDQMKKMAGIADSTPTEEYNKDWYWHDSEGKVVRDTWGDPVKSGSHPASQKKQPWDFFSDDIDRDTKMDQLDEGGTNYKQWEKEQVAAGKPAGDWNAYNAWKDQRMWNDYETNVVPNTQKEKSPSSSLDEAWWDDDSLYNDEVNTLRHQEPSYKDKVKKAGGHINRAVDQVTAKGYGKEGDSWHQRQTAQDKARNPKSYDPKGRKVQMNPITGEPNVQWGEKRAETSQGASNRARQEEKSKAYKDKVKKAGGHLNKFGQDVKDMFSGDSYAKAKAAHKKKLADRKKLSKHEQNMAQLRDQGYF